jgi:hypothetical protein
MIVIEVAWARHSLTGVDLHPPIPWSTAVTTDSTVGGVVVVVCGSRADSTVS